MGVVKSFVVFGLLVMAWGYWALSGGSNFAPQQRQTTVLNAQTQNAAQSQDNAPTPEIATALSEANSARAATLIAFATPDTAPQAAPVTTTADMNVVAPPTFTPLSERQAALAAIAAAEAAERAQSSLTNASLRPAATAGADLRVVDADRVNLRDGPGTDFVAIDQLTNGTIAEVLEYGTGNWVRVQVQGTSQTGWMSSNFLLSLD